MVLENENVAEALIILQVQHAIPIPPEHVLHGTFGQTGERCKMVWRLNHDFVGADAIHLVKQTFSFAVQIAFYSLRGKLVWHYSDAPARSVGYSPTPIV